MLCDLGSGGHSLWGKGLLSRGVPSLGCGLTCPSLCGVVFIQHRATGEVHLTPGNGWFLWEGIPSYRSIAPPWQHWGALSNECVTWSCYPWGLG